MYRIESKHFAFEAVTSGGQMEHKMHWALTPAQPNKLHRHSVHAYTARMPCWVVDVALQVASLILYT